MATRKKVIFTFGDLLSPIPQLRRRVPSHGGIDVEEWEEILAARNEERSTKNKELPLVP